jgi:hypothetical protein
VKGARVYRSQEVAASRQGSTRPCINISTSWGRPGELLGGAATRLHKQCTSKSRNPKQIRRLRGLRLDVDWSSSQAGKGSGSSRSTPAGGPERKLGGGRRSNKGLRRPSIPGQPSDFGQAGRSRALSTSPWRSEVRNGRPVSEPAGTEALGAVNCAARPRCAGMEAGASTRALPGTYLDNRWLEEEKRRSNPSAPGNCFGDGPMGETSSGRRAFRESAGGQSSCRAPSSR